VRITIIGTAPRPGFDATKMGKNYSQYPQRERGRGYTCNITMNVKYMFATLWN
jgi:hypothetical protein